MESYNQSVKSVSRAVELRQGQVSKNPPISCAAQQNSEADNSNAKNDLRFPENFITRKDNEQLADVASGRVKSAPTTESSFTLDEKEKKLYDEYDKLFEDPGENVNKLQLNRYKSLLQVQAERDQDNVENDKYNQFFSQLREKLKNTDAPDDSAVMSDQLMQFAEHQKELECRNLMLSHTADEDEGPSEKVYFTSELYRTQKKQEQERREQLIKQA